MSQIPYELNKGGTKSWLCPECDWDVHTHTHTTSVGIHRRVAHTYAEGHTRVVSEVMLPLKFKQKNELPSSNDAIDNTYKSVDWSNYRCSSTALKHPVLMPIIGVCTDCGCQSLVPVIEPSDGDYQNVRLFSNNGAADVHICPLKCSNCQLSVQAEYGGSTSWLLVHGVMPATSKRAHVVFDVQLLKFLASVEKAHGSYSVASGASTLMQFYASFSRSSEGLPLDPSISQEKVEKSLALVMPKLKGIMVTELYVKNQRPEHCSGCSGTGVPAHSSDANVKLNMYHRVGGDFVGTGSHYTNKFVMGSGPINALQAMYSRYDRAAILANTPRVKN